MPSNVVKKYFAAQPPDKRALLEKLHALVIHNVPDPSISIKWGVPFYTVNGKNVCALASFKEHVGINFFAPPKDLADPKKKLEGERQEQPHAQGAHGRRHRRHERQALAQGRRRG